MVLLFSFSPALSLSGSSISIHSLFLAFFILDDGSREQKKANSKIENDAHRQKGQQTYRASTDSELKERMERRMRESQKERGGGIRGERRGKVV